MKHLLSYAVLVTCSLFTSAAFAESPACSSAGSVAREPLYDMTNVPRDARLAFEWDTCGTVSIELFDEGGAAIPFTEPDSVPSIRSLKPSSPLEANRRHRIVVREGQKPPAEIPFTTGEGLVEQRDVAAPIITKVEITKSEADRFDRNVFRIDVDHAGADRLGVFILQEGDEASADMTGGREHMQLVRWALPEAGKTTCFTVTYEDPSGTRSAPSAPSCVTEPDDGGCNASPHKAKAGSAAGSVIFLAAAVAFARRRRTIRAR